MGRVSTVNMKSRRELKTAAVFIGPNLLLLTMFSFWPLLQNVYLSFVEWDLIAPEKIWVGLANWIFVFSDPAFREIMRNTAIFTTATVGITLVLGLAVALLLNQPLRGRNAARTIIFAPTVLSGSAIALVWVYMFDPNFGLIRAGLSVIGVASPRWLTDPAWAMPAVVIVYVWKHLGYSVVIFLAGLQSIPAELYEAARVDGASAWDRLWAVTIPGLGPITFFLLVTSLLASFQAFDLIKVMTSGGPILSTTTLIFQLYREGFVGFHAGVAAVYALTLFALMLALTIIQLRYTERRVNYA